MPLRPGAAPTIVSANIREFHKGKTFARTRRKFGAARANAQAVAVAMRKKRETIIKARQA